MIQSCAAVVHAEKLSRYIDSVSQTKPYSNTQKDLADIYKLCAQIQANIVNTLAKCDSLDLISVGAEISVEVDTSPHSTDAVTVVVAADTHACEDETVPQVVDSIQSSCSDKRRELAQFDQCLSEVQRADMPFSEASDCAQLLALWYHNRFRDVDKTGFRYNINNIRQWSSLIILAYGKAVESETLTEFTSRFRQWCDSLHSDHPPNYPLPYEIYSLQKSLPENLYTSAGLLVWQVLYDAGLCQMQSESCTYIYFDINALLQSCEAVKPSVAFWHSSYCDLDEQGLKMLKLHPTSGGDP